MPPTSSRYTLVGFSDELDWRPVRFVKPVPQNRICSTCGLVRILTALLPCGHVLCNSCYEHCALDRGPVCPLDSSPYHEEDVEWRNFPAENILQREVKCWNEETGCEAVIPASEIGEHFRKKCGQHSVSCPKCSATVLCRNVCEHIASDCSTTFSATREEERTNVAELKESFDEAVAGIRTELQRILADNDAQREMLHDVNHGINSLGEAIKDQFPEADRRSNENFVEKIDVARDAAASLKSRCATLSSQIEEIFLSANTNRETSGQEAEGSAEEVRGKITANTEEISRLTLHLKESTQKALKHIEDVLLQLSVNTTKYHFIINGVNSLKETAMEKGSALFAFKRLCFRGYFMVPGVDFRKHGDSVSLHILIDLKKGPFDEGNAWPFAYDIKLSIVHPVSGQVRTHEFKTRNDTSKHLTKPEVPSEGYAFVTNASFYLKDLERDGYVNDNELLIIWEIIL
ncbi:TNF receptor-associated factor 6-like isoform X1 [Dermacentor silvarum]|uniref:TNF receptor-associated factor 6-like isoform X1 n=1 Tax=Dermacentor silvarum TaxID=543639 RepID=UPI0021007BB1|nr:TNF receptor-associated factor 6-like isoform X1 [Dermacentor silvarum]